MLAAGELTGLHNRPEATQVEPTTPRVLTILSLVLEKLVGRNDRIIEGLSQQQLDGLSCGGPGRVGKSLNGFRGVRAPSISIGKYLERLYKYTSCSPSCFVVGYVYIDRLMHKHPDSLVVSLSVHRLLITSIMVASKVLDDM